MANLSYTYLRVRREEQEARQREKEYTRQIEDNTQARVHWAQQEPQRKDKIKRRGRVALDKNKPGTLSYEIWSLFLQVMETKWRS